MNTTLPSEASVGVTCRFNGRSRSVSVDVRTTLLQVLRDELELTGTKRGCNSGICGACNVLVDGRSRRACLTLAVSCAGLEVRSIEGLSGLPVARVVQQAFVDTGAIQCGFCMSGMIVSAAELLGRNPAPTRDEIRHGIAGNLCRCSGYVKVIEAVELAARRIASSSGEQCE